MGSSCGKRFLYSLPKGCPPFSISTRFQANSKSFGIGFSQRQEEYPLFLDTWVCGQKTIRFTRYQTPTGNRLMTADTPTTVPPIDWDAVEEEIYCPLCDYNRAGVD